jgi:hypothetical protein
MSVVERFPIQVAGEVVSQPLAEGLQGMGRYKINTEKLLKCLAHGALQEPLPSVAFSLPTRATPRTSAARNSPRDEVIGFVAAAVPTLAEDEPPVVLGATTEKHARPVARVKSSGCSDGIPSTSQFIPHASSCQRSSGG